MLEIKIYQKAPVAVAKKATKARAQK